MNWKLRHSLSLIAILVITCFIVLWGTRETTPLFAWQASLVALTVFTFVCGRGVTGRWLGALIDERNVMSLARFQILMWTLLVLSAYLVAALYNIFFGLSRPLHIEIQHELWWLMGISTSSLVLSPLILAFRKTQTIFSSPVNQDRTSVSADSNQVSDGPIAVNRSIYQANWSDLFTGEEVGNSTHLDVARLQMFFFTMVTGLTYAVLLGRWFSDDLSGFRELPSLDESMVALVGISHLGYLASKAVPSGKAPPNANVQPALVVTPSNDSSTKG